MKPYIGITGFMTRAEVRTILNYMPENPSRLLMVGVLANSKTMEGIPNKRPNRYPKPENLGDIFEPDKRVLNLIHFNTKEPKTLYDQIAKVRKLAGPNCHGFQLNTAWPNLEVLTRVAIQGRRTVVVLQVGGRAFEMINHDPRLLANKVAEYEHVIDYVLLDPSGGYGVPFDTEKTRTYLDALSAKNLNLGLGVAGGLSPQTLNLLEPLVGDFPNLCIDAEGKLRDHNDNLDLRVAGEYIKQSLETFNLDGLDETI